MPKRQRKTTTSPKRDDEEKSLCFQDGLKEFWKNQNNKPSEDDADLPPEDGSDDVANVFFELANSPLVSYRLPKNKDKDSKNSISGDKKKNNETTITLRQDVSACGQHTGGIVWETSYLLLDYLIATNHKCQSFLEVGAGCGLVGLGVHKINMATKVYMTETPQVMPNLLANVKRNSDRSNDHRGGDASGSGNDNLSSIQKTSSSILQTCPLDWTQFEKDCQTAKILPHSIDTIVGTDVVFCIELVVPLLKTLRYLAHQDTTILLCLQERCKDSHQLLLDAAADHGLVVEHDILNNTTTNDYDGTLPKCCEWGRDLECKLLKLSVLPKASKKKKRKRSKH